MKLLVKRFAFLDKCTISKLSIDGVDSGIYILEDKYREQDGVTVAEWKVQNETAIPKGTYKVVINFSYKFKKELPQILNVPGFEGIRIHSGNSSKDTEGCLLVGKVWFGDDRIGDSRVAFNELFPKLKVASDITLTIE